MWKQQLLWQTDRCGRLIAEAGGYLITVERMVPRSEARFTIACSGRTDASAGQGATAISGIRSTARCAIAAAERIVATLPPQPGHRPDLLLVAELLRA